MCFGPMDREQRSLLERTEHAGRKRVKFESTKTEIRAVGLLEMKVLFAGAAVWFHIHSQLFTIEIE